MAIKRRIKKFFSYVEMWEDPNNRATKKLSMVDREKMVLGGISFNPMCSEMNKYRTYRSKENRKAQKDIDEQVL